MKLSFTTLTFLLMVISPFFAMYSDGAPAPEAGAPGGPATISSDLEKRAGPYEYEDPAGDPRVVRETLSFGEPSVTYSDGMAFVRVSGGQLAVNPGAPELPQVPWTLTLPYGSEVTSVRWTPTDATYIRLDGPIAPSENVRPIVPEDEYWDNDVWDVPPREFDADIYGSDEVYPADWASHRTYVGMDRDTLEKEVRVVVHVTPVRYDPEGPGLWFTDEVELEITYDEAPVESSRDEPLATYDLLVVTPDEFKDKMNLLVQHRKKYFSKTKLVTMEEVKDGTYYEPWGRDDPEILKAFLYNASRDWKFKAVIIGGDVDKMPVRHADCPDGYQDSGSPDGRLVPTDLYFADMETGTGWASWDHDSDNIFGEWGSFQFEDFDLAPEILIGRLPASSVSQMGTIVNKIINYELEASESAWFEKAVFVGLDTFVEGSGCFEGEYSSDHIADNYLTDHTAYKFYQSLGNLTATNVNNEVNKGAGFLHFADHGHYTVWGSGGMSYSNSNIQALTNGDKLPMACIDACLSGGFDNEHASNPYSSTDCMSENFVLNADGGAVACIAASRVGWGGVGFGTLSGVSTYFTIHLYEGYSEGENTPGEMLLYSNTEYLNNLGINSAADYKTVIEYNIMGDPVTYLGGIPVAHFELDRISAGEALVDPGQTAKFTLNVSNTGLTEGEIDLEVVDTPTKWKAKLNLTNLTIPPKSFVSVTLKVTPNAKAAAEMLETIEVMGTPRSNQDPMNLTVDVEVDQVFGVGLACTSENSTRIAGDTSETAVELSFPVEVINPGNGDDIINVTVNPPDGWDGKILPEGNCPLGQDACSGITVNVTVPAQVSGGTYSFNITAKSVKGDLTNSTKVKVTVPRTEGVDLVAADTKFSLLPGEQGGLVLSVINPGNDDDSYGLTGRDVPANWTVKFSPATVDLAPYGEEQVDVTILPATDALAGDYEFDLKGTSKNNASIKDKVSMNITVARVFGVSLASPWAVPDPVKEEEEGEGEGDGEGEENGTEEGDEGTRARGDGSVKRFDPGDVAQVPLSVYNTGNAPAMMILDVNRVPDGWVWDVPDNVTVDAYNVSELTVPVHIPGDAEAGTYQLNLSGSVADDDGNATSISSYVKFSFKVKQFHGVELLDVGDPVSEEPGETLVYDLSVENKGNGEDTFDIQVSGLPKGWKYESTLDSVTMDQAASRALRLRVTVPKSTLAGDVPFTVTAVSRGDDTVTSKVNLVAGVDQVFAFDAKLVSPNTTGELDRGDTIEVGVWLENLGNGPDNFTINLTGLADIWLDGSPDGFTVLKSGANGTYSFSVTVPEDAGAGQYNITLAARSSGSRVPAHYFSYSFRVSELPEPEDDRKDDDDGAGSFLTSPMEEGGGAASMLLWLVLIGILVAVVIAAAYMKSRKKEEDRFPPPPGYADEEVEFEDGSDEEVEWGDDDLDADWDDDGSGSMDGPEAGAFAGAVDVEFIDEPESRRGGKRKGPSGKGKKKGRGKKAMRKGDKRSKRRKPAEEEPEEVDWDSDDDVDMEWE